MDRTVLRPSQPAFSIYETVYPRASVLKGYVQPVLIVRVEFDPSKNEYLYSFSTEVIRYKALANPNSLLPVKLYESELLDLCDALQIQVSVLQRQYDDISAKYNELSDDGIESSDPVSIVPDSSGLLVPTRPKYGFNDVVYLAETAQTTGNLEAYRVTGLEWNNSLGEWVYSFRIVKNPGFSMTVGDADDLRRAVVLTVSESELCNYRTALGLAVSFLGRALNLAVRRFGDLCESSSSSSSIEV